MIQLRNDYFHFPLKCNENALQQYLYDEVINDVIIA